MSSESGKVFSREYFCPPSLKGEVLTEALARPDPIFIENRAGEADDELDQLPLVAEGEELDGCLEMMLADAVTDPEVARMFEVFNLWKTEPERIRAYEETGVAKALAELMGRFDIGTNHSIADVGCGMGWLAYSLDRLGYKNLVAMEPNAEKTQYLKGFAGDRIEVISNLDDWKAIRHRFDALVSVATIHHWQHIPWISIEARRTMKPGAYWFVVMEWFADTPAEFVKAMKTHPTRERYRMYEWAYPVSAYVDLIQSAGFSLTAVIPKDYRENAFLTIRNLLKTSPGIDEGRFNQLVDENLVGPNGTVELFWEEVDARRRDPAGPKFFTRPQVLVFRRVSCEKPPQEERRNKRKAAERIPKKTHGNENASPKPSGIHFWRNRFRRFGRRIVQLVRPGP